MTKPWLKFSDLEKVEFLHNHETDCTFSVGIGDNDLKKIESYKFVLCSISPVFDRMFNGDFKEATSSEPIPITDIEAHAFEAFLKYVYGSRILMGTLKSLIEIAEKYMAEDVIKKVKSNRSSFMKTPKGALECLEVRHVDGMRPTSLEEHMLLFKAIEINCPYILHLNPQTFGELITIAKLYSGHVNRGKLFEVISCYCAEHNISGNAAVVLLNFIDFCNFSIDDYLNYVETSEVFDLQMKHQIILEICRAKAKQK